MDIYLINYIDNKGGIGPITAYKRNAENYDGDFCVHLGERMEVVNFYSNKNVVITKWRLCNCEVIKNCIVK